MGKVRVVLLFVIATVVLLFVIVVVWGHFRYPFLTSRPATESVCGRWVIDSELTTGFEGDQLLRTGHQHDGYLELTPDGRFTIQAMPKFWAHSMASYEPSSASGTWRWENDNNNWVMVNLYFEQVNGKKAGDWDWGHSYIAQKGSNYYLYFIIDFDSYDFVVVRKS